jgi:hypothetical protein
MRIARTPWSPPSNGERGRKVKIVGNGRIYTAAELAIAIINEEPR